jgi:hypothetical protein
MSLNPLRSPAVEATVLNLKLLKNQTHWQDFDDARQGLECYTELFCNQFEDISPTE